MNVIETILDYNKSKGSSGGGSGGGTSITVDSSLSLSSSNPVQNRIVTKAINTKADLTHTHTEIEQLEQTSHSHTNKEDVLDKFSLDSDNNLLFDNKKIESDIDISKIINDTEVKTDSTWSSDKINRSIPKTWTGTRVEFEDIKDTLEDGTIVYITDDEIIIDNEINKLKQDSHTHTNKTSVLDKLSVDENNTLLFNNKSINTDTIYQYNTIPTANADNLGKTIQYIGITNGTYIHNYFYECTKDSSNNTYIWINVKVQNAVDSTASIDDSIVSTSTTFSSDKITNDFYTKIKAVEDLGDKADKSYVDTELVKKVNVTDMPTNVSTFTNDSKYQTDTDIANTLLSYAKASDIPTNISSLNNDSNFITNAVDNLISYYKKTETYSQEEINKLIGNLTGKLSVKIVTELPTDTSEISTSTMYLIAVEEQSGVYNQYMYIDSAWALLGTTSVDLTNYYTKNEVNTKLDDKADKLSIPTVPTKVSAFENDESYLTEHQSLDGYAKTTEIPVVTNDLTNELKAEYDLAVNNSHTHNNKTELDSLTALKLEGYDDAVTNMHTHTNKDTLDKFTEADDGTILFNGDNIKGVQLDDDTISNTYTYSSSKINDLISPIKENSHSHDNKEVIDKFTENDNGEVLYNGEVISGNVWTGTKAEYDAIISKDNKTTYIVTDEKDTLSDYIIDDTTTSADKTWSSKKINNELGKSKKI